MHLWLTADETIAALAQLEPRHPVTYRQLRYWDSAGVVPASRVHARGSRLYNVEDLAMLRLAIRVLASGRTLRQVSEALRYRSVEIRAGLRSGRALALTFGLRGVAEVTSLASIPAGADGYALRGCWRGVIDAMRDQRREQPRVWTGCVFMKPSLVEVAATA